MRRSLLVGLGLVMALVVSSPALADTLSKTVAALKQSPVYVEPGTPGATVDTAGELQGQMNNGDNIVIVMLTPGSVSGDLTGFAQQINSRLGGKKIVGVSAGDQIVAFSTLLPAGVAADLMHRASSISVGGSDTLKTFIHYTHSWQQQHPQEPASKPAAPRKKGGSHLLLFLFLGGVLGLILTAGALVASKDRSNPADGLTQLKLKSPVRDDLEVIAEMRSQIKDPNLRELLTTVCTDVEAYFRDFCVNPADDTSTFREHLRNLRKVLVKYVQVQNSPSRYWDDPQELMKSGFDAVKGFENFVVESIHRDSRHDLTEFNVNTDILSAQSYR